MIALYNLFSFIKVKFHSCMKLFKFISHFQSQVCDRRHFQLLFHDSVKQSGKSVCVSSSQNCMTFSIHPHPLSMFLDAWSLVTKKP